MSKLEIFGAPNQFGPSKFGDVPGGNYTEFEDDGTMVAVGDATCWLDENFNAILGRGASAPDLISLDSTNIEVAAFDGGSTSEQVSAHREIQHDYKEGSDLVAHIHWMPVNANAGDIEWFLEYYIRSGATVIANDTIAVLVAAPGVAWQEQRTNIGTIAGASLTIGMQVSLRLYRVPGVGNPDDTYASDAAVTTFGYHYETNMLGSREITTK